MTWGLGRNEAGIKLWDDRFVGVTINKEIRMCVCYEDILMEKRFVSQEFSA